MKVEEAGHYGKGQSGKSIAGAKQNKIMPQKLSLFVVRDK